MAEQIFTNCSQGGVVNVHVKDRKIIRIRPLNLDEKDGPSWTIEAKGRKFSPFRKVCLAPYTLAERARTYSEDRIKYPLKRVDFNPNSERHPENRGKSEYERISWDKALDIVAREMKIIRATYGPAAITSINSPHHNWGNIGYRTSTWSRFFNLIGFTDIIDNPNSWEGWQWGATHTYGFYWRLGLPEPYDMLEDALKNSDLIIHWGNDPDSTHGVYGGQDSAIWRLWLRELGKKQIFIDPFCNYTAGIFGDKWIAPRPGTDAAMAEAIAYVWLTEDTYDKEYIKTHTIGFNEWKRHILGEEDNIQRTPNWAGEICGIPSRTITTLAREWASKRTMLAAGARGGESSICRQAYAHEWARLMVILQAMQGLGKPGVGIWGTAMGAPFNALFKFPGYSSWGPLMLNTLARKPVTNSVNQRINRMLFPDAILTPPIHWLGEGFCGQSLEQQFTSHTYPEPNTSEVKMLYRYGGAQMSTLSEGNKWVKAYQSPKLEFIVNQDCWWCTETRFADIILPACTNYERNDIGEWANCGGYGHDASSSCNHRVIVYQQKCIEPLYESKSDYQIFSELAERLGVKQRFTEGNSEEDWIEKMFYASDLPKYISFEDFKEKGYYMVPVPTNYQPTPSLRWFYKGRECDTPDLFNPKKCTPKANELSTYSGKIEFVSESLKRNLPDDEERPPLPKYIPSWEGHTSELAKKYPLQLISPHPRFSFHSHHDSHVLWLSEIPGNRILKDGYYWRTVRIHPSDASPRNIKDRDIVKLYNDRGAVLGIAQVTERMRPGVIHSYCSSSKYDPLEPGKPYSIDRGGCVNLLTNARFMSKNVAGMAPNSCLIEITKWEK